MLKDIALILLTPMLHNCLQEPNNGHYLEQKESSQNLTPPYFCNTHLQSVSFSNPYGMSGRLIQWGFLNKIL
jgi:hypothetical protein